LAVEWHCGRYAGSALDPLRLGIEISFIAIPPGNHRLRRLARKRNLAARLRQINPTGKSLPIYRNHVKP
jgi:hypothetical protein